MQISAVLTAAISAYHTYNRFDETPELYHLKHKIEQLIPIVESAQILSKRDPVVFAPALEKTIITLRDCKGITESNSQNIHALLKSGGLNAELKQLTKDIGDIIKEMTLAVVALNGRGAPWTPKVTIVGPSGSGKSSFLTYWQKRDFKQDVPVTVGAGVMKLTPSPSCQLDVWDTAGQDKYMGLSEMYLKGANIVILMFSLAESNNKSVNEWFDLIKKNLSPGTVLALVGTKLDLVCQNKSRCDWGRKFATSSNMLYFETSAKSGENVEFCMFKLFSRLRPPSAASSSASYDDKSVIYTAGFLYKVPGDRGNKIGGWQERFFLYDTNDLKHVYYFKTQKDCQRGKSAGKISLCEVQSVKQAEDVTQKLHSFLVVTPKRTWYFYAKTSDEQRKWINMFSQVCVA